LKYALRLGLPTIVLGGLGFVALHENFYVSEITITGNDRAASAEIRSKLGFFEGEHILLIPKRHAERALEDDPRIAWAEVRRRFNGRVDVIVREEHPAMLLVADRIWGITDFGLAIPFEGPFQIPNLTVLTCENNDFAVSAYKMIDDAQIVAGLDFYNSIKCTSPQFIDRISEIHVAENREITMILSGDGLAVKFGSEPAELRILRLTAILDEMGAERADYSTIDLRYTDQAIIKLSQRAKNTS